MENKRSRLYRGVVKKKIGENKRNRTELEKEKGGLE